MRQESCGGEWRQTREATILREVKGTGACWRSENNGVAV